MPISIDELLLRVCHESPFLLTGVNGALVLVCRLDGKKEHIQLPPEDADRILQLALQQVQAHPPKHVPPAPSPARDQEELQELLQLDQETPPPDPDLDCSCLRCGAPAQRQTLLCVVHERAESQAVLEEDAKEQDRLYEEELRQGEAEGGYDPDYDRGPW